MQRTCTGRSESADAHDGQRLFNVTKLVPEGLRWSRRHNGQNELLDHVLTSEGLMPRVNGLRRVPTMSILNEDTPNMIGSSCPMSGVHNGMQRTALRAAADAERYVSRAILWQS